MTQYRDNLGTFYIPDHLWEKTANYVPEKSVVQDEFDALFEDTKTWSVVKVIKSTSSNATHRVERRGNELRCTCQGFRIGKKGFCKHTKEVAKELGI